MTSNIFRIFKPQGEKESPVEKRRAQLRTAQQTYRSRKDEYAKSLEREIARARATEASLLREVQRLENTVQKLVGFLRQQGMEVFDEMFDSVEKNESATSEPKVSHYPQEQQKNQLRAQSEKTEKFEATAQPTSLEYAVDNRLHGDPHQFSFQKALQDTYLVNLNPKLGVSHIDASVSQPDVRLGDLDPIVVGMEFVLTLERPCLGHLHGNPDEPNEPAGHALTTSAQLLSIHPLSSTDSHFSSGLLSQDVPAAMLDSLLSLSSELSSDQEVTPVQAWNYIRRQPNFGGMEARILHQVAEALREAVKCHGFGAVVEQEVFKNLVYEMMFLGQPF